MALGASRTISLSTRADMYKALIDFSGYSTTVLLIFPEGRTIRKAVRVSCLLNELNFDLHLASSQIDVVS